MKIVRLAFQPDFIKKITVLLKVFNLVYADNLFHNRRFVPDERGFYKKKRTELFIGKMGGREK